MAKSIKLSARQERYLRWMNSDPFNGTMKGWTLASMMNCKTGIYRTPFILQEKGLITITITDEPTIRIYTITEAGQAWLEQHAK